MAWLRESSFVCPLDICVEAPHMGGHRICVWRICLSICVEVVSDLHKVIVLMITGLAHLERVQT